MMSRVLTWSLATLALLGCPGQTTFPCRGDRCADAGSREGGAKDGLPIPATCGNGTPETGEECDDGNQNPNDSCLNNCRMASCGDGVVRQGVEECDNTSEACVNCKSVDFQVNRITVGDQRLPSVAVQSDGTIVVVWQDASAMAPDTSGTAVRMRRFKPGGIAVSDAEETVVPTTMADDQRAPRVAISSQDRALVVWTDWSRTGGDTNGTAVRGQLLDAAGAPAGSEVLVNTTTNATQATPAVAAAPDGSFVVAFNDISIGGSSHGIDVLVRRVGADGQPVAADYRANTTNQGDQQLASVAVAANGNVLVVWQTWSGSDGEGSGIGIAGRLFGPTGNPLSPETILNSVGKNHQENPQVAATSAGFAVVWDDASGQGDPTKQIRLRMFSADGTAQAPEQTVNATLEGDQSRPAVAARGADVAVVWEDPSQAALNGLDVRGRRFRDGAPLDAADQLLNTQTHLDQARPAAAFAPSGELVVVWESTSGLDNNGYGIRMRILAK